MFIIYDKFLLLVLNTLEFAILTANKNLCGLATCLLSNVFHTVRQQYYAAKYYFMLYNSKLCTLVPQYLYTYSPHYTLPICSRQ